MAIAVGEKGKAGKRAVRRRAAVREIVFASKTPHDAR